MILPPSTLRDFSRTLLLGLPTAGLLWMALLRVFQDRWIWQLPAVAASAAILLFAIIRLSPAAGSAVYRGWHVLRRATDAAISNATLALVYLLVVTPAGLIRRTVSRSPVEFSYKHPSKRTFWKPAPSPVPTESYLKQH